MRRRLPVLAAFLIVLAVGAGAAYGALPHLSRAMLADFERQFSVKILAPVKDSAFTFVDPPSAYYLENFGVTMSSKISLVPGYGPTMFGMMSPEQIQTHHRKVLERLPVLRERMKLTLFDGASHFEGLDDNDRLAVAVTVYHFLWEETTEIPSLIVIQGTKKALLEARTKTVEQGRDRAVQMKEMN